MTTRTRKVDTYIDHEQPVAERYKWWGVYLIREKRRLQGIAEAVQAEQAAAAPVSQPTPIRQETGEEPILSLETPDELLTRVDAEMTLTEALAELESSGDDEEESKAHGDSVRDELKIPDDITKRKLSGRAALLGRKHSDKSEDF